MSSPASPNPFADLPPVNPYAPPAIPAQLMPPQQPGLEGLWRKGDTLVMHKMAQLPPICVKSNQYAKQWLKRNLQWHNPWVALTLLISPLIYIIVALIVTKRATIHIGLTEEWFARRRTRMLIGWGIGLLALALFTSGIWVAGQPNGDGLGMIAILLSIILLIVAVAYGQYACRLVYPQRIDDSYVWLKGVNREFLDRLPMWPYPFRICSFILLAALACDALTFHQRRRLPPTAIPDRSSRL
jgi:hypothetical protein